MVISVSEQNFITDALLESIPYDSIRKDLKKLQDKVEEIFKNHSQNKKTGISAAQEKTFNYLLKHRKLHHYLWGTRIYNDIFVKIVCSVEMSICTEVNEQKRLLLENQEARTLLDENSKASNAAKSAKSNMESSVESVLPSLNKNKIKIEEINKAQVEQEVEIQKQKSYWAWTGDILKGVVAVGVGVCVLAWALTTEKGEENTHTKAEESDEEEES